MKNLWGKVKEVFSSNSGEGNEVRNTIIAGTTVVGLMLLGSQTNLGKRLSKDLRSKFGLFTSSSSEDYDRNISNRTPASADEAFSSRQLETADPLINSSSNGNNRNANSSIPFAARKGFERPSAKLFSGRSVKPNTIRSTNKQTNLPDISQNEEPTEVAEVPEVSTTPEDAILGPVFADAPTKAATNNDDQKNNDNGKDNTGDKTNTSTSDSSNSGGTTTETLTVAITSPTSSSSYTTVDGTITLSGSCSTNVTQLSFSSPTGVIFTDDDCSDGTWQANLFSVSPGSTIFTLDATSVPLSPVSASIEILYGGGALALDITSPNGGVSYSINIQTLSLSGTCSTNARNLTSSLGTFLDNDCSDGTWELNPHSMSSGVNTFTISAEDAIGSPINDAQSITYIPPPSVTITSPNGGSDFSTATLSQTISGTCSTNAINAQTTIGTFSDNDCTDGTWSLNAVNLSSGANAFTITFDDAFGASASDTINISYDAAATLAITLPNGGTSFSTTTQNQTVSGTCSTNAASLSTTLGTFSDSSCADNTWSLNALNLSIGTNTFTISAINGVGISVSDSITITFESAPALAITLPNAGVSFSTNTQSQTVKGTCSVNAINLSTSVGTFFDSDCTDGTWELNAYNLAVGANVFTISATNSISASVNDTITISYDALATLTISAPNSGTDFSTNTQSQTISGGCSLNAVNLSTSLGTFSDSDCSDGTWSLNAYSLSTGVNTFTIEATNAISGSVSDTLNITYDALPTLAISSPNSGNDFSTTTQSQTISGTCSLNAINLSTSLGTFSDSDCSDGTWALNAYSMTVGSNAFTISATNILSNSVNDTITISYDASPSLAVTSPNAGSDFNTNTSSQTVSGTCSVNVINLSSSLGSFNDGDCSDGTWSLNAYGLTQGANTFTVSGTNAISSPVNDSITITFDSLPTLAITAPNSGSDFTTATQSQTISGTCSLNATNLSTSLGTFSDSNCSDGTWSLNAYNLTVGVNTFTIEATNIISDSVSDTINITYLPPPSISYATPQTYTRNVAITALSPTNTGGSATSWSVNNLPLGLAINPSTGVITGTPILGGVYNTTTFTVTATNSAGSDTFNVVMTVNQCATLLDPDNPADVTSVAPSLVSGYYEIDSLAKLNWLRLNSANWVDNFRLMADIDMDCVQWAPIGTTTTSFSGEFDGNGYKIQNLYVDKTATSYLGLFGYISGKIYDLTIQNPTVIGSQYIAGLAGWVNNNGQLLGNTITGGYIIPVSSYAGGLAGNVRDGVKINRNSSSADVKGRNSYTGDKNSIAQDYVGGLVGFLYRNSVVANSSSSGDVHGRQYTGGLVGSVDNQYNRIIKSYATGNVSGVVYVGGITGKNGIDSLIANSYSSGDIECYQNAGAGTFTSTGGIAGDNYGQIYNVYSSSYILAHSCSSIGGIAGVNRDLILQSLYTGILSSSAYDSYPADGTIGRIYGGTSSTEYHEAENYYDSDITCSACDVATGTGMSNANLKIANNFPTWDMSYVWTTTSDSALPTFRWQGRCGGGLSLFTSTSSVSYASGAGTVDDPYIVDTADRLNKIRDNLTAFYKLSADIDLDCKKWVPLGNSSDASFKLDGDGHTISNIIVEDFDSTYVGGLVGQTTADFFLGNIKLDNIDIIGADTTGGVIGRLANGSSGAFATNIFATGVISGRSKVGGVAAYTSAGGQVYYSRYKGTILAHHNGSVGGVIGDCTAPISHSSSSANVFGGMYAGGVVGTAGTECLINQSFAEGSLVAGGRYVGGLVGSLSSKAVLNSYSQTGTVYSADVGTSKAGGLAGYIASTVEVHNVYSKSNIVQTSGNDGGLIGDRASNFAHVYNSYWDVSTSNQGVHGTSQEENDADIYGDVGTEDLLATGYNTATMKTQGTYTNWDFTHTWVMSGYPTFRWTRADNTYLLTRPAPAGALSTSATGTCGAGPYQITTPAELLKASEMIIAGGGDEAANYCLANDIDMSGVLVTPLGVFSSRFSGDFDGSGHKISNLMIMGNLAYRGSSSYQDNQGLFSYTNAATIHDLTLEKSHVAGMNATALLIGSADTATTVTDVTVGGSVLGISYVGSIIGYNLNATVQGTGGGNRTSSSAAVLSNGSYSGGIIGRNLSVVTVNEVDFTGNLYVSSGDYHGGIAGDLPSGDSISNSTTSGTIYAIDQGRYIGGIVGQNQAGTVSSTSSSMTILNAGAGSIGYVGGIVGRAQGGATISSSHYTGVISYDSNSLAKPDYIGGVVGYTNSATISNSSANTTIKGNRGVGGIAGFGSTLTLNASYSKGTLTCTSHVGGFVGEGGIALNIYDSYSGADVTADDYVGGGIGLYATSGQLDLVFAYGAVSGTTNVGGLIGGVDAGHTDPCTNGSNKFCMWNLTTSGTGSSAGTSDLAKNTNQMTLTASGRSITFGQFDMTGGGNWKDITTVPEGQYPQLIWE